MKYTQMVLVVAALFVLSACGSKDGDKKGAQTPAAVAPAAPANPGNPKAYVAGTADCSTEFTAAYNKLAHQLKMMEITSYSATRFADEFQTYEALVADFESQYAKVECNAKTIEEDKLDPTPTLVKADEAIDAHKKVIAKVKTALGTPSSN